MNKFRRKVIQVTIIIMLFCAFIYYALERNTHMMTFMGIITLFNYMTFFKDNLDDIDKE